MDIEKLRKKLGTLNDDDQSWRKIKRKPNRRQTTTGTRKDEEEKRVEKIQTTLKLKHPWNKIEDVEEVNVYIVFKEKMKVISFASEETRKSWRLFEDEEAEEEEEEKVKTTKKKRPPALVKVIASKLETKRSSTQKKKKSDQQQQRSGANVFIVTGSQPVVNEYDLERLGMTTTAFARGAERIEEEEEKEKEKEKEQ
jgi:hypothetical protein